LLAGDWFGGLLIGVKFFWLFEMAEFLGNCFLADIWPIFKGGENRDQRRCLLVGDSGRNPIWRMWSATAAFLIPAGGQLASERDVNAATPLKATSCENRASSFAS
jgi:hypothetical protein